MTANVNSEDQPEAEGSARMVGAILWISLWALLGGLAGAVLEGQLRAALLGYGVGLLVGVFGLRLACANRPEIGARANKYHSVNPE